MNGHRARVPVRGPQRQSHNPGGVPARSTARESGTRGVAAARMKRSLALGWLGAAGVVCLLLAGPARAEVLVLGRALEIAFDRRKTVEDAFSMLKNLNALL